MGTSPLYSLSLCWWDEEDNKALEESEIQYIRLGRRGVHRAKGMCPPRTHTPTSRSLSRWLKFPLHDLYGPLPQAVFPMVGPSTGACTPRPKGWTKVAVCRACGWCLNWGILTRASEGPWSNRQLEIKGREQAGGWYENLRSQNSKWKPGLPGHYESTFVKEGWQNMFSLTVCFQKLFNF